MVRRLPARAATIAGHSAGGVALLGIAIAFWQWRIIYPAVPSGPIGALGSDLYTQYIPILSRAVVELRSGHVPQWNPDQLAGVPMLPNWFTFGAFYPLNLLFLLMPVHVALGWTMCLHIALAGAGMYWLVRVLGLSPAAGRFAAVTYMLSRPTVFEPNLFHSAALAPAVLASWVRLAGRPTARSAALAALMSALQFSSGGTQMAVYTAYAVGALVPFAIRTPLSRLRPGRTGIYLAAAALLTIGLIAVLLLPTAAVTGLSERKAGGLSFSDTLPFPTPSMREMVHELLSPTPGLPRLFFGWTALVLAAVGAAFPSGRTGRLPFILVTVLGLLLVLGPHTPAYAIYHHLPTGNWFRVPQRAAVLVGLGVACLAAFGVELCRQRGGRAFASLLVVLPALELFRATWSWLPYPQARSASAVAPPAAVEEIRASLGFRRAYVALNWQDRFPFMEKLGTWQAFPVAQDYDSLTPAAYGDYFRALLGPSALVDPIFAGRYLPVFGDAAARRALDLLAVQAIVAPPGAIVEWMGRRRVAPPGPLMLIQNDAALPRAFIVHRVEVAADQQAALRRLGAADFTPRSTAMVIGAPPLDLPSSDENESVDVLEMTTDAVTLRATLERPGLLVLNDLLFPGWQARVDSATVPIVPTNGLFRGVFLEAGQHTVRFTYRAPLFLLGLIVSGLSLATAIAMLVVPGPR